MYRYSDGSVKSWFRIVRLKKDIFLRQEAEERRLHGMQEAEEARRSLGWKSGTLQEWNSFETNKNRNKHMKFS